MMATGNGVRARELALCSTELTFVNLVQPRALYNTEETGTITIDRIVQIPNFRSCFVCVVAAGWRQNGFAKHL